jgi:GTPase
MMYALSIMYKIKLPMVVVFNKKDVVKEDFCVLWTKDYDELETALNKNSDYISSYSRSLCLVLEEFYKTIKLCGVSSQSGEGFDDLMTILNAVQKDYMNEKEEAS